MCSRLGEIWKREHLFWRSRTPLRRSASRYAMPARMWRHGIHSFLELSRQSWGGSTSTSSIASASASGEIWTSVAGESAGSVVILLARWGWRVCRVCFRWGRSGPVGSP